MNVPPRTIRKIVHIVPAPFCISQGIIGGAERYALELARAMAEVAPTALVTFGDKDSTEKLGDLTMRIIGNPHYVRGQRTNPIAAALASEILGADVAHCHQQHVVASTLTAAICRMTGRGVFVSDLGGGGLDISGYVSTDRWYHGHLHISEYSRTLAGHQNSRRGHVILGGVDSTRFRPDPSVPKNGGALFVGRLLPHKGVNYLIEGLPSNMSLAIVGQGYDQRFTDRLRALASGKKVTFHHNFDDAALLERYQSATCIVLPSVYTDVYGGETRVPELLGQTLLEGMACGLPAICTAVASMPEIVVDGVTGFIVPPNDPQALHDKLAWLQDYPERARAMGEAARKRVRDKFTWSAVVRRCLDIYQS